MDDSILMLEEGGIQAPEEHGPQRIPHRPERVRGFSMRVRASVALALCVAAVMCKVAAPETADVLRRWVVGDGSERMQQAFFVMEQSLEQGEGLGEAWTAFCGELTDEAT